MRSREVSKVLIGGTAVALAGLALVPGARAWVERTVGTRETIPSGSGCIQIQSGMSHGDANSQVAISALAHVQGFTRGPTPLNCSNDASTLTKQLTGQLDLYLIKLVTDTNTRDLYTYCRFETTGPTALSNVIRIDKSYPTAPCGAGYYALVACLQRTVTNISPTPPTGGVTVGWFDAAPFDCNYSAHYHPVGVGDNIAPGPAVNL